MNTRRQHHSCWGTEGVGKRLENCFSNKNGKMVKMQFQGLWLIVQYNSLSANDDQRNLWTDDNFKLNLKFELN